MKGNAIITGNITGYATRTGSVTGWARDANSITGRAEGVKPIDGSGDRIREAGLIHWMKVIPETPQHLVWLNPQGIDYNIETSTGLNWKII